MKFSQFIIVFSIVLLVCICFFLLYFSISNISSESSIPESEDVVRGALGAKLDTYLTRITPYGFSGAVLVARKEQILLNKGYGLAIRRENIPCTSQTVFSVGSITKQFTAAGIMKLEMMGKLHTSDPISKHLNGVPDDKKNITLHHLLTHTAGIINFTGPDYQAVGREETIRKILAAPLEYKPGERFSYSNAGYSLLAAVLEKVSGESYEEFLNKHIFKPAGMKFTGYRLPNWGERVVAHWYVGDKDNGTPLEKPYPYWNLLGNGGILSTTGDLYKWYLALKGDRILSAEAKKKIFTPFLNDYGYGWDVLKTPHGTLIQHNGGSLLGNSADFRWFVDEDVVIIIFCNQSYGREPLSDIIKDKVAAIVFGEKVEIPPEIDKHLSEPAKLREYEGTYKLETGGELKVREENQCLRVSVEGQAAMACFFFENEKAIELSNKVNALSVKIFKAALQGDFKPFEEILANKEERYERVKELVEMRLKRYLKFMGKIVGVEAVATLPSNFEPGAVETIVRINGEKRDLFFLLIWKDGKNIGVAPAEIPEGVFIPFLPVSPSKFAGYSLPMARNFWIEFARNEQGQVAVLKIITSKGKQIEELKKVAGEENQIN